MSSLGAVLPLLGIGSMLVALIGGAFAFKVNRATATKIITETQQIAKSTALAEAESALKFAHLRFDSLEKDHRRTHECLGERTTALLSVLEAIDTIMAGVEIFADRCVVTLTSAEFTSVRTAVREARKHLR